ncbi:MAG: 2,3-bisphosphoglycerate-independent phosphoglycerate mutase [Psychrobium sp.]|nr:2,3-bisphosphoglycerate-independent phosphoglycerate mutase [Psychrobium sp.]
MPSVKKPLVLLILDGWGYREDQTNNAIALAKTPTMDRLWENYPHTLISGSGQDVGLPDGQMGNSEVGHVNIGSGRIVYQNYTRINKAITDGEFDVNVALVDNLDSTINAGKAVDMLGLFSHGGVHSHVDHMLALIKLAAKRGAKEIYLHAFLDGRDTPPRSALASIEKVQALFKELGIGQIASLVGRYYAMDRDQRWDRVEIAYHLMAQGKGLHNNSCAVDALKQAYARDENDEFVGATSINKADGTSVTINDGDAMFFMNFRADRAREISRAFVDADFAGFERKATPTLNAFVQLTQYADSIISPVAYSPEKLNNVLGQWLQDNNKTQLRISETEKYAHVTFFFNGGIEDEFEGEDRILIPSPDVATYDLQPAMNSTLLTDKLVAAIAAQKYDVIICNYPNGDMVGHTGILSAAIEACEAVDSCIERVLGALDNAGGECLITADHGNAEQMVDETTAQAHTAHTCEPVPFIYVGRDATPADSGKLSDIAPTMLRLLDMEIPPEMTGTPLMTLS